MRTSRVSLVLAVIFGLFASGPPARAGGGTGRLDGVVVASGGAALAGVSVAVDGQGVHRSTSTDGSGAFAIDALPVGSYRVRASLSGFTAAGTSVNVGADSATSIRLTLAPRQAHEKPKSDKPGKAPAPTREPMPADESMPMADAPSVPPMTAPPMPSAPSPRPARHAASRGSGSAAVIQPSPAQPTVIDGGGMNTEAYARIEENPFFRTGTRPLSTFSIDVDSASYANTRSFLTGGSLPPKDAVRVEELINYFAYDYPSPTDGKPFSITTEVGASPWHDGYKVVRVGLQTPAIADADVPARNLTFLLDVSGSMEDANKLPLLKQAMGLLVETLRPQDRVAIVVYAGSEGLALPPTSGADKATIRAALADLTAGGSTNGAAGIQLAYQLARKTFIEGGINRVILCTDGDFNVGVTSEGDLTRLIEKEREAGVFLTVLGFGFGNLKDSTMEKLADKGNGNYGYVDSLAEARKLLVKEAGATLVTVAKDVKLQIEFNPTTVAGYRLIGYENRLLRDEDFNDDTKDAGEIGAGHAVTALYEIVPAGRDVPGAGDVDALKYQAPRGAKAGDATDLMTVKIRYKAPRGGKSRLLSQAVASADRRLDATSNDFRWAVAVAGFGMMLRESPERGTLSWAAVSSLARGALGKDREGYRHELLRMIDSASKLRR